jgi:hypothetical protein
MSQRICAGKYDEALFGALHHMPNVFFARGAALIAAEIID